MADRGRLGAVMDGIAALSMTVASITMVWYLVFRMPDAARIASASATAGANAAARPSPVENIEASKLMLPMPAAVGVPSGAPRPPVSGVTASAATPLLAVFEFADFECPFCARYARDTLPHIKRDFVETGKVAYVFKHFPLPFHKSALPAAEMAACADEQSRFWDMHSRLFSGGGTLAPAALTPMAKEVGLDETRLRKCLASVRTRIDGDTADARRMGVESTPTFLIGEIRGNNVVAMRRRIMGAQAYDTFKGALQELLDERSAPASQ